MTEPLSTPAAQGTVADAPYNIKAIAQVISISYGENPEDDAPLGKICDPNNEPLPNWMAYEEQAKAVFIWMMAVIDNLSASPSPEALPASGVDALMKAIRRAEDGAGTLPAKEAVKLRPADWHAVCRLARALTSAPAPEDRT